MTREHKPGFGERVAPVFVSELELGSARSSRRIGPYADASILVRLHGEPMGIVNVPVVDGVVTDADVVGKAKVLLAERIAGHAARDGGRTVRSASEAEYPCEDKRRAVRESGPLVSVIVPTRNRPAMLLRCVDALLGQDYPRFEVIVVDNAPKSTESVDALLERYGGDDRLRFVLEPRAGISFARNCGVAMARGDIVAFTDDDVRVDPGWLTALVSPFLEDGRVACATGLVLPAELETSAQRWTEEFGGFNKGYDARTWDLDSANDILLPYAAGRFGSGQNMAFDTRFLRAVGGFNPALGVGSPSMGGEDLAAFFTVLATGRRLAYVPDALVWHIHRRDLGSLRRQLFAYGVGLSAYLTSCVVHRPERLFDLLPRVPAGARHLLSSRSAKNARKGATYPRHLTLLELIGVLLGPIAYARGLVRARRLRRPPPVGRLGPTE